MKMLKSKLQNDFLLKIVFSNSIDLQEGINDSKIIIDPVGRYNAFISEKKYSCFFFNNNLTDIKKYTSRSKIICLDFNKFQKEFMICSYDGIAIADFDFNVVRNFDFYYTPSKAVISGNSIYVTDGRFDISKYDLDGQFNWRYKEDDSSLKKFREKLNTLIGKDNEEFLPINRKIIDIKTSLSDDVAVFCEDGNIFYIDNTGKRIFNYYTQNNLHTFSGIFSLDGKKLYILGCKGIFCIDIVLQLDAWDGIRHLKSNLKSVSLDNRGERILILDDENNIILLDSNGKHLFQQNFDSEKIVDAKISFDGKYIILLFNRSIKTFDIMEYDSSPNINESYLEINEKTSNLNILSTLSNSNIEIDTKTLELETGNDNFTYSQDLYNQSLVLEFDDQPQQCSKLLNIIDEFKIDDLFKFYTEISDKFFLYCTYDGGIGLFDIDNRKVQFHNKYVNEFSMDNIVKYSLYGKFIAIFSFKQQKILLINFKGEIIFQKDINFTVDELFISIYGELISIVNLKEGRIISINSKGEIIFSINTGAEINSVDFDYILSRCIYSVKNSIFINSKGKTIFSKKMNSAISFVDINGRGDTFTFITNDKCYNLSKNKFKKFDLFNDITSSKVSLDGKTGIVNSNNEFSIIDFVKGKIIVNKKINNITSVDASLSGENICVNTEKSVVIYGKNGVNKIFDVDSKVVPSFKNDFFYSKLENKVVVFNPFI